MKAKDFDFIATHQPLNAQAKNVISQGVHYEYKSKDKFHQNTPCDLKSNYEINLMEKNFVEFKNFSGIKYGDLTVIGLARFNGSKGCTRSRWLVKCVCGIFEIRTSKAIKNHLENNFREPDCCKACGDLKVIRQRATALSVGYDYKEYCEKFLPRNRLQPSKSEH